MIAKLIKIQPIKLLIVSRSLTQIIGVGQISKSNRLISIQKTVLLWIISKQFTIILVVQLVTMVSGLMTKIINVLTARLATNVHRPSICLLMAHVIRELISQNRDKWPVKVREYLLDLKSSKLFLSMLIPKRLPRRNELHRKWTHTIFQVSSWI